MKLEFFIAKRLTFQSKRTFSKTVVVLAIVAISLSIAVMLISISIAKGFQKEIKNKLIGFSTHIQVTQSTINYTFENEPIGLDSTVYKKIKHLSNVRNIQSFTSKPGIIKSENAIEGIVLKGISGDYNWDYMLNVLKEVRMPDVKDTVEKDQILISRTMAGKLGLKLNDNAIIYFIQNPPRVRKLKICGIYETGLEDIDNIYAICDIRHIQKLNGWNPGMIGGYEIILSDLNKLEATNDRIRLMLGINEDTKTIKDIYPQIFDWLNLLNTNVTIILLLMIIVAIVNMITALLIIILEKSHLIALFKSFGSTNGSISRIFLYNSALLIAGGMIIGNLLGMLLLYIQYQFRVISLPVESYYVSYVPVLFTWKFFILVNIGTFLICSIVMYLPARLISRIDPVKVLRFE